MFLGTQDFTLPFKELNNRLYIYNEREFVSGAKTTQGGAVSRLARQGSPGKRNNLKGRGNFRISYLNGIINNQPG